MKNLVLAITFVLATASGAFADQLRNCVGPFTLSSVNYSPGATGIPIKHLDGNLTVHLWKTGPDAISVNVETTLYNTIEDPLGGSFVNMATRTGTSEDGIGGPFESIRFNVTSCGTDCTTKAKVCGRISN